MVIALALLFLLLKGTVEAPFIVIGIFTAWVTAETIIYKIDPSDEDHPLPPSILWGGMMFLIVYGFIDSPSQAFFMWLKIIGGLACLGVIAIIVRVIIDSQTPTIGE